MEFFDDWKTGDLISRLVGDTEVVQMGFSMNIARFVQNIILISASLFFLFYISWKLCLALFITIIPLLLGGVVVTSKLKFISENMQEERANFSVVAEESFSNIKTVKSFANEHHEIVRFNSHNAKVYNWNLKRGTWTGILMSIFSSLVYAILVVIMYLGSFLY